MNTYPNDPRVRFYRALGDLKVGLRGPAAAELRTALGDTDQLRELSPEFTAVTRYVLAMALLEDGDNDGARAAAAPVCGYAFTAPNLSETLTRSGLCAAAPSPQDS